MVYNPTAFYREFINANPNRAKNNGSTPLGVQESNLNRNTRYNNHFSSRRKSS